MCVIYFPFRAIARALQEWTKLIFSFYIEGKLELNYN